MLKIIDLFAGAGGISLGAARAGFELTAAVEIDKFALETHQKNFPATQHLNIDVATLSGDDLMALVGLKKGGLDGLVGGPPCQGFSYIGKRDVGDDRNNLFMHFFRLVSEISPAFFLAENVPGILSGQYDAIREQAFSLVRGQYEMLQPIEVKASDYGAPTTRTRIFFIGYDPKRVRALTAEMFKPAENTVSVLVKDALKGLPIDINPAWLSEQSGWQPVEKMPKSHFRLAIVGRIPDNVGDPSSIERFMKRGEVSGCMGTRHGDVVKARYAALDFGEKDKISKSVKLHPDKFCPTLRAGTGSDKGSFQAVRPIHCHAPRVITPREAARLQGFPDWFVFHRTKWHSFRQIGNSVSPIVSEYLLSNIIKSLV
ncbi:DNA cytosine methyltransferase [Methylovulum psychrotolerans]|uniref:Cytosine-specific methyltransferase n=1 Tax=Methylovulum psychrotolerans TaxID=1704499 RepID=A0A2S5CQB8_9GAMM|nr:DNA cytosine methyltransferase [Methylovulum psychrotolerans]POZ52994.1 DNA cytosine methyltransferase [Methylovulum psychrotolerans]